MPRVEFHCHTIYSPDSLTDPGTLVQACQRKGIDRVVVTDHNTIQGALRASQIDPQRVILGEEIMTAKGELLAFFVKEEIPANLLPLEVIHLLRQQEAFISVSHPFDSLRKGSWNKGDLEDILPYIDAIEIFNSRCFSPSANRQAGDFARQHGLLGTVGSDAHAAFELGRATLLLHEFEDANGLKNCLKNARAQMTLSSPWVHFYSRYAAWYKRLAKIKL